MRKTCFAAIAVAGLAASVGAVSQEAFGATVASGQSTLGAPHKPTWTERVTAPFKTNPFAGLGGSNKQANHLPPVTQAEIPFDPKSATPELYIGMAQMSHRAGSVPQARQFYQKALALNPNHLDALLGAARMEDREGRLDVAQMLYQRAATTYPRNATALNDLALCLARRGDMPGARRALEQGVQLEPTKVLYRNNLAKVLIELNILNGAMMQLAAVHPPAAANYNMGVLLSERGRSAEAAGYLSQALALDPNLEPARAMLSQKVGPPLAPPASVLQPVAQASPVLLQSAPPSNDSILPTPETVATVPWKPPVSIDAVVQPAPRGGEATTISAAPALPPTVSDGSPALLPPVN